MRETVIRGTNCSETLAEILGAVLDTIVFTTTCAGGGGIEIEAQNPVKVLQSAMPDESVGQMARLRHNDDLLVRKQESSWTAAHFASTNGELFLDFDKMRWLLYLLPMLFAH